MYKLDDIVPPSRRKEMEPLMQQAPPPAAPRVVSPRSPSRFPYITVFFVLLVIAASIGVLFYFSGAKVAVTPNSVSAEVQSSFTASQSTSSLPYQVVTVQKIATQTVASTGTQNTHSFASGSVVVYNTQSKSQQLIANTRFATPSGLIFRIHSAVSVPAGSTAKPGSVTATVYADQAGDTYNVGPTSFTVPGLAGTPQATMVYGRSTTAFTGGATGNVPVIDSATGAQTRAALITALGPDLLKDIQGQIPAGYVLLTGAATTTYQELSATPSSTAGMVDMKEQGTLSAVVFPNAALAGAIATSIPGLGYQQGQPLTLASTGDLRLTAGSGIPTSNTSPFSFTLNGTVSLVYTIDSARIAAAVSGKTRSAAEVALTNYPEIKSAIITLRPFWRQSFPQDPSAISIVVTSN